MESDRNVSSGAGKIFCSFVKYDEVNELPIEIVSGVYNFEGMEEKKKQGYNCISEGEAVKIRQQIAQDYI